MSTAQQVFARDKAKIDAARVAGRFGYRESAVDQDTSTRLNAGAAPNPPIKVSHGNMTAKECSNLRDNAWVQEALIEEQLRQQNISPEQAKRIEELSESAPLGETTSTIRNIGREVLGAGGETRAEAYLDSVWNPRQAQSPGLGTLAKPVSRWDWAVIHAAGIGDMTLNPNDDGSFTVDKGFGTVRVTEDAKLEYTRPDAQPILVDGTELSQAVNAWKQREPFVPTLAARPSNVAPLPPLPTGITPVSPAAAEDSAPASVPRSKRRSLWGKLLRP